MQNNNVAHSLKGVSDKRIGNVFTEQKLIYVTLKFITIKSNFHLAYVNATKQL